ncbi:MAG: hypothetical protein QMB24_15900 [Spirosomataceae bacterium]
MKKSIIISTIALIIGLCGYYLFAVGVFNGGENKDLGEFSLNQAFFASNVSSSQLSSADSFTDTSGRKIAVNKYDVFSKVNILSTNSSQYYLAADNMKAGDKSKNTGLSGFNYSPLMIYQGKASWKVKDWKQGFVYSDNQFTTILDGNITYSFRPDYEADRKSQLAYFDLKFPDFTIPAGKTTVLQMTPLREKQNQAYHNKGITYAREGPIGERYAFVSDDWLYALGCPPAYQSSQKDFDEWLERTSAKRILRSFQERITPLKDYGYIMLNWEAVAKRASGENREKLTDCLRWYKQKNYHAKLTAWNESPIKISRIQLESDSGPRDFAGAIAYGGDLNNFSKQYNRRVQRFPTDHSQLLDVLHVGGYMNYPTNYSVIHHYLLEYFLNKKYFPKKEILATIWTNQELVGDFPLTRRDYANYYCYIKPAVFPQTMFNWGVWTVAVGDGFDCWYDPWYVTNDISQNGFNCFNSREKDLPIALPAQYPHSPLKNVDDLMAGVWAVSQHKDIIEAKTNWRFIQTPDESLFGRKPMIAYKFSEKASEALVLIYDAFSGETVTEHQTTIQLPDGTNKPLNVKTFGTRTSVMRVKF